MEHQLTIYNTLNRKKELFVPLHAPHVGMYVCGPTVYGDAHLGHARPSITFDVLFRYLTHLGYKVRYVRNITDVGHLEHDADDGEDKIEKKARLEELEPMEVVQYYLNRYHKAMEALNVLSPSIEPHASGHIIEQIELVQKILDAGYAYESEGSVYFDVAKYNKDHHYGRLSGRNLDDVLNTTRELDGQPFGIAAAFDVGVGQFVHDHDFGMEVQDGLRVHLFQLLALVEEPAARHERKPFGEGFRFGAAVRFDVTDADVHACVEQLMRLLQHAVGLAYPGAHADVYLELSPVRAADQLQKPLNAAFLVHTTSSMIYRP